MMRMDIRIFSPSTLGLASRVFLDLLLAVLGERLVGETQIVRVQMDWTYRA